MNCKTCKTCNRKFHACTNCGLYNNWEYYYCSEMCWKESRGYKINKNLIVTFLDTLVEEQFEMFADIKELDDDYEFIIEDLIEQRRTR